MLNNACSVPCFEHSGTLGNIRNAWEHKGSQRTNKRVVSQRVFQNPLVIGAISKHTRAWLVQCPPAHPSSSMCHFLGRAEGMCLRGASTHSRAVNGLDTRSPSLPRPCSSRSLCPSSGGLYPRRRFSWCPQSGSHSPHRYHSPGRPPVNDVVHNAFLSELSRFLATRAAVI